MKTVLLNARIFIGNGEIIERGTVIIKNDRIFSVHTAQDHHKIRDCDEKYDITGCTIFPGFIDCHVHICLDGSSDPISALSKESRYATAVKAVRSARETLMAGVTTIRDMGGYDHIDIAVRDAINSDIIPGPRILSSGRLICMTGGHGWQIGGIEADGPDAVRKAAREQLKKGSDVLKFMATGGVITPNVEAGAPQLTVEEMRAGIDEAHKAGKKTAAHAQSEEGILNAIKAGIDTIEHGYGLNSKITELMKKKNIALIPTLKAAHDLIYHADMGELPPYIRKKIDAVKPRIINSMKMAVEAGLLIGMGTDAGIHYNRHGDNLLEIANLIDHGLSLNSAFQSATLKAAGIIGLDDQIGSLEEGKLADMVIFREDPLEDINVLFEKEHLSMVIKNGRMIRKEE